MVVFRNTPEEWQRLDWMILQNGYACLYLRKEFLLLDIAWFRGERYRVIEFDCTAWAGEQALRTDVAQRLRLQESGSFKELGDRLKEADITGKGLVLVLHHLDAVEKELGQELLDVLARAAQWHLLLGERLLTLAQVDDLKMVYKPVGARPVLWNPHEWLDVPG
ncbi:hypothetical protein MKJ04_13305 [Pontibacter sp. E15-1]|uniref:hypothetical protein n=1 Tax=Pontibacter sp. E15-1 TaxID=2919918 RepID=UPI001F4F2E69|nr:hypothetical protein [Pontibacter sp. E15-1]MCJ8165824.1 hypothetical protein [Pontibacter sp. E15-1]